MRFASVLRALCLPLLLAGCASSGSVMSGAPPAPTAAEDYLIGVDDMVQVSVWRNPEELQLREGLARRPGGAR